MLKVIFYTYVYMNTYVQEKLYKNNVKYIHIDMLRHIFPAEWYTQQIQKLGKLCWISHRIH